MSQEVSQPQSGVPNLLLVNRSMGITLTAADGAIIGRRTGAYQEYLRNCPYLSSTHAQLNYNAADGNWTITDKNSSNGTRIDGQPLVPEMPCILHEGARLQLANIEFIVETAR
ncbi:MAG: FHA domain-containing protein [Bacteroidaceae bacterium]|nr:FHA domain-containing protein [Bacteroidaceae bacterium]MCF0185592.1 FHA domain-containing protein [Bacteroidaceae bacterium]